VSSKTFLKVHLDTLIS